MDGQKDRYQTRNASARRPEAGSTDGETDRGNRQDILTSAPTHSRGIKVRLTNGVVGRVKEILP